MRNEDEELLNSIPFVQTQYFKQPEKYVTRFFIFSSKENVMYQQKLTVKSKSISRK